MARKKENWGTRLGVILAVSGSAVGLGNFLRFPGLAALYGGGAFMIPYFISFLVLGIPIAWIEWSIGRLGGSHGFNSAPGIFQVVSRNVASRVFGALAVFIPVVIFMYYVFIEAWCLGYAWDYLVGAIAPPADPTGYPQYFSSRFNEYIGVRENGALFTHFSPALLALVICFALNFWLIARGLTAGIEAFCKYALPLLNVAAIIVLVRVLTLGTPNPEFPDRNVINGLGFMWDPKPVAPGAGMFSALANPQVWLEAAGQIFFTLSVGFGIIMTYASYLRRDDDVALSALTASATNEFSEVCLGGLITIPAAFIFLGAMPLQEVAGSSIGLGFHAVPVVFEYLPLGHFFGFLWFGLLTLAAIAASISMLQPALAFLEEGLSFTRAASMTVLAVITGTGAFLVVYLSQDSVALGVMDFWVGSALLLFLALFEVILFGWILGAKRGIDEVNRGSDIRVPSIFVPIILYICPAYIAAILVGFTYQNLGTQVRSLLDRPAATVTVIYMIAVLALFIVLTEIASRRWQRERRFGGKQN